MYLFLIAVFGTAIFTFDGYLTLLAIGGSTLSTIGTFQDTDLKLRAYKVPSTMLWITHNALVPTPMGVLIECMFLGSNLLGFYRFYRFKRAV